MRTKRPTGRNAEKNAALVALGQQIRKVRESRDISQEDFAFQAGIDRSYYGSIERGERNVAALNLMRIAATLNCEVGSCSPKRMSLEVCWTKCRGELTKAVQMIVVVYGELIPLTISCSVWTFHACKVTLVVT